jgi:prepilin-type N-terminal cleavage/methylation domain-containing protein
MTQLNGQTIREQRGLTLIEVLIAAAILAVGLLALVSAFPIGYVDVTASGGQSRATSYAQAMMEQLKNQPFPAAFPVNGADIPDITPGVDDVAYTRSWRICPEPAPPVAPAAGPPPPAPCPPPPGPLTVAPNRLARITVAVTWGGGRPQTVVLESMRAE